MISVIVGILYLLMKSANAFGAISATVSSGMSAVAIAFFNMPEKDSKEPLVNPKIQKAIAEINQHLNQMVQLAIGDLVQTLRHFPNCLSTIETSISQAETELLRKAKSKEVKAVVETTLRTARAELELRLAEIKAQLAKQDPEVVYLEQANPK